ncbi:uncharacterized protein LOC131302920 [Rhododendron vialii]|uniref:uncharacterized protein LOC131302920 n=1 Tax=Rhododendron vialii TaxID=182163 RepID=UPI00265EADD2|nr:uncharacterized protein LOC131302920 [Rhododendron vialii]
MPVSKADIAAVTLLNQEKKTAYDQILHVVFNSITLSFFIDGPGGTENPLPITESAILTKKNQAIDEINEAMITKFLGEETTYLSFDMIDNPLEQGTYMDFLNSIMPTGMPSHRLVLKNNCPILLFRNINPSKELCNGTRLICREF